MLLRNLTTIIAASLALGTLFSTLHPHIPNGTYPFERLIDGGESDLDIEAAWPLIWPQRTVVFQTDDQFYKRNQTDLDTPYVGFWNTFYDVIDGSYCDYETYGEDGDCTDEDCLDPVCPNPNDTAGYQGQRQCGVYQPTNVISISFTGGEGDFPARYLRRQCDEIMKLSLQGVTVVESSGDFGVGSNPGDGGWASGCAGEDGRVFYPAADCGLSVCACCGEYWDDGTVYYKTSSGYSGGGFSNYFDSPEWQKGAIEGYFDEFGDGLDFTGYDEPGNNFSDVGIGVYRKGWRGYPDVSAIGVRYYAFTEGRWSRQGGTSLSAPIWAAVLTLVNERRIAAGKSTVGFVHPVLYAHPEVFNDVTEGNNTNCNSTGFIAAKGWDPVSGLGTPNFPKLVELFLSLP